MPFETHRASRLQDPPARGEQQGKVLDRTFLFFLFIIVLTKTKFSNSLARTRKALLAECLLNKAEVCLHYIFTQSSTKY